MSCFPDLFKATKETQRFLWTVNTHGEITIERFKDEKRGAMATLDDLSELNFALSKTDSGFRLARKLSLWEFGVKSVAELVAKLNAKGSTKAKRVWNVCPWELRPSGIDRDHDVNLYVLKPDAAEE